MPYISKEKRPQVDQIVEPLVKYINSLPVEEQDGTINYVVTKILKEVYPRKYFHVNRALGVLNAVTQEFYRRVVGPYEDTKISENGDVE